MSHPIQESSWHDAQKETYPKLDHSPAADIVIIGGGMAGVLAAYTLGKAGKSVILLEKDVIGNGATMQTTAMLTESLDTDFGTLITAVGESDALALVKAHSGAIRTIEQIAETESIDCDLKKVSVYLYANEKGEYEDLVKEAKTAERLGVKTEVHPDWAGLGFKNAGYVELKDQGLFHPLKFLYGVAAAAAKKYGVQIFEHTEVERVVIENGKAVVHVNGQAITASWAVSATYEPFHEPLRLYFTKGMYKTYMFEAFVTGLPLIEGSFEDTNNPYHFTRIEKEGEGFRLIIGGEDHRMDLHVDEAKSFNALKEYLDTLIPEGSYEIRRKWTGPILEPVDGFPLIGQMNDDPIIYVSAFSGTGMTYSVIAADIVREIVEGEKESALARLLTPRRILNLRSFVVKAKDYFGELAGGALKNTFTKKSTPEEGTA